MQTRVSASRHSIRSSLGVGAVLSQSPSSVGKAQPRLLFWIRGLHPRNTSEDGVLQLFSNKCNVISIISFSLELHTVALAGFSSIVMNVVENPNLYFNG